MWKEVLIIVFIGIFFSILFLQSSLDKVFNWKSEMEFNKQHFGKTFLKPFTPLMLIVLTLMEFSCGVLSIAGIYMLLRNGETIVSCYANSLCATTFIALFFGQRIAKDYGGAQSLVNYFTVSLIGIYLCFPA